MRVEQMREAIKQPYGIGWGIDVDKMPDRQVKAIYFRMVRDGILRKEKTYEQNYYPIYCGTK